MKDWIRQQPGLAGVLAGAIACALGLIIWSVLLGAANERDTRELRLAVARWNDLARAPRAPTRANVEAAQAHLDELRAQTDRMRAGLEAQGSWDSMPGFRGVEELYFDLVGMVEQQRAAFRQADIALSETEQFGYGQVMSARQVALTDEDAEAAMLRIHRQRQTLSAVLDALRAAGPSRLLGVERAPVQAVEESSPGRAEDLFTVAPTVTAAVPDTIETYGVRVRFEGQTKVLRAFLEQMRSSRRPVVVRNLGVAPASGLENVSAARPHRRSPAPEVADSPFASFAVAAADAESEAAPESRAVPIIEDNDSIFTVVLEGYALLSSDGLPAAGEGEGPR